ncbi:MAG: hypothetical protein HQ541_08830 [Mariniphaga sp.]|nr:hypothetical protein [Mariniphaga sp.]
MNNRLDPQIQKIATDKFNIVILDNTNEIVYGSDRQNSEINVELTNPLQALTVFSLGIALDGETISELVNKRTNTDIYFVCIVSFVLLIAGWLIIRIFSKQIELAYLKSDFVSYVSHEIRTPLSLINMYAETIDMGRVDSEELKKDYMFSLIIEIIFKLLIYFYLYSLHMSIIIHYIFVHILHKTYEHREFQNHKNYIIFSPEIHNNHKTYLPA